MEIELTQNKIALIDDADWPLVAPHTWCAIRSKKKFYAMTTILTPEGRERVFLHKLLLGIGKGIKGDHVNGDSLDNRRSNLRVATSPQNAWNKRAPQAESKTSRFKGVFFDKAHGKFRASILNDGKRRYLGYFDKEEDAARAYDAACVQNRGEWAVLNFPDAVGLPLPVQNSVPGTESI